MNQVQLEKRLAAIEAAISWLHVALYRRPEPPVVLGIYDTPCWVGTLTSYLNGVTLRCDCPPTEHVVVAMVEDPAAVADVVTMPDGDT